MKNIVTTICILLSITLNAQEEGRWYEENHKGTNTLWRTGTLLPGDKPDGKWKYYTREGKISKVINWKNGLKDGAFIEYDYNTSKPVKLETYKDDELNGTYKTFSSTSGKLEVSGHYLNGKAHNKWEYYYNYGDHENKVLAEVTFNNGVISDPVTFYTYENPYMNMFDTEEKDHIYTYNEGYYSKGKLSENSIYFSEYDRTGKWQGFYEDGKLFYEGSYKKGEREGTWTFYHKNGQLAAKGNYKNNKETGLWQTYHKNGKIMDEGSYKNGEKIGSWKYYYANGNLKSERFLKEGPKGFSITWGVSKSYQENGKPLYDAVYDSIHSNGINTLSSNSNSYDENGDLYMHDVYNGFEGYELYRGTKIKKRTWKVTNNVQTETYYYKNEKVKEIRFYKRDEYSNYDVKTGIWKYYNEDGSLKESIDYSR